MQVTIGTRCQEYQKCEDRGGATTPATNMNSRLSDIIRPDTESTLNTLVKTNMTTRYDPSITDLAKNPPNPEALAKQIEFIQSHINLRCSRHEELVKLEKQELSKTENSKNKHRHLLTQKRTETERKLGIQSKSKPSIKNPLTPIRPEMKAELISKNRRRRSLSLFVRPVIKESIDEHSTSPGPEFTKHGSGLRQPF